MLFEVEQAANRVRAEVDPDARIIFGSTILDNMEGRIRVSVVATGIDAMEMRLPKNVEPLRPNLKPLPLRQERIEPVPAAVAPAAPANAVLRQQEALAAEMSTAPQPAAESAQVAETYTLGGDEAPQIVDEEPLPAVVRPHPARQEPAPAPQRRWGLFSARKAREEPRVEPAPVPMQRAPLQPRASAQVMSRAPQQAEPSRPVHGGDDLFPDHKRDEQFEIPAFLRRQSN
jgi:cell division protein FtsZ